VVPLGCTTIRRDVLESWPAEQPFFSSFSFPPGRKGEWTKKITPATISHDVFFCRIAQDHGWSIWLDTSLRVKHLTLVPIDDGYFINWYNQAGWRKMAERSGLTEEQIKEVEASLK
jgi:hypothetical protein